MEDMGNYGYTLFRTIPCCCTFGVLGAVVFCPDPIQVALRNSTESETKLIIL